MCIVTVLELQSEWNVPLPYTRRASLSIFTWSLVRSSSYVRSSSAKQTVLTPCPLKHSHSKSVPPHCIFYCRQFGLAGFRDRPRFRRWIQYFRLNLESMHLLVWRSLFFTVFSLMNEFSSRPQSTLANLHAYETDTRFQSSWYSIHYEKFPRKWPSSFAHPGRTSFSNRGIGLLEALWKPKCKNLDRIERGRAHCTTGLNAKVYKTRFLGLEKLFA